MLSFLFKPCKSNRIWSFYRSFYFRYFRLRWTLTTPGHYSIWGSWGKLPKVKRLLLKHSFILISILRCFVIVAVFLNFLSVSGFELPAAQIYILFGVLSSDKQENSSQIKKIFLYFLLRVRPLSTSSYMTSDAACYSEHCVVEPDLDHSRAA